MRTDLPLEREATLTFTAYDDNYRLASDPDSSNNTVTFGIGVRIDNRVPGTTLAGLALLALGMGLVAAWATRKMRPG